MSLAYSPGTTGSEQVLFATDRHLGLILLNRPKAINSLTTQMCLALERQLEAWAADDRLDAVAIQGAGDRGLCAGGDVKAVRAALVEDPDSPVPLEFFSAEYRVNQIIADYPKPYIAEMTGVVMGGGLGVSAHGSTRLVTADSRLAMPETLIGFFPDVGMRHLLARAPGEYGTHLALTGATIGPREAVAAGLADRELTLSKVHAVLTLAAEGHGVPDLGDPTAERHPTWIDECYAGDSAADILARLEAHADPGARVAADALRKRSPFSVSVSLAGIRRAATLTLPEVLAQDRQLCEHFRKEPDFLEGVRCQLVDKGDTPRWRHASLAAVPAADVEAVFGTQ